MTPDEAAESLIRFVETFDMKHTGEYWAPRGPRYSSLVWVELMLSACLTFDAEISVPRKQCLVKISVPHFSYLGRLPPECYWLKSLRQITIVCSMPSDNDATNEMKEQRVRHT